MQLSPVVTLVLSVVFGAAAIVGARLWLGSSDEGAAGGPVTAPVEIELRPVLVAVRNIPRGVTLDAAWFEPEKRPVTEIPQGAFASVRALEDSGKGRRTLVDLASGDVLSEKLLLAPGMRASLSAKIEPGLRAYTIRTSDVTGVGGFVLPGDRVDVIFIEDSLVEVLVDDKAGPISRDTNPIAKVLLQNVEVLAVDLNDDMTGSDPDTFKTATLGVTLEQAQMLSVAGELGSLSFALRGSADDAFLQAEAVSFNNKPAPKQVAYQPPRPAPLRPQRDTSSTVEVILGDKEASYTVPASQ